MKEMSTKSARKTLSEHYKALILFELGQYLGVYSKSTKLAHVNLVLYSLLHLTSRVGQRRKNQTIGLWTHIFTNTFQLAIYSKCFCSQEFFFCRFLLWCWSARPCTTCVYIHVCIHTISWVSKFTARCNVPTSSYLLLVFLASFSKSIKRFFRWQNVF